MTLDADEPDSETPLRSTELRALRRLAEPASNKELPRAQQLWAARYRIENSLGRGGMGDVFLARDVLLDRLVALKVLRNTSEESYVDERRLLREARAAARAEHEKIARVYDAGTWNDQAFIAMEYVRGDTLRVWMKTHTPTESDVVAIVQQLLEGLRALHEQGLVHRDLKPENVMVTPGGSLRILDLGIARRVAIPDNALGAGEQSMSLSLGFGVGTPGYMAPEQWRGEDIDARADLFALGVIAYELVTGHAPFRGGTNLAICEQTVSQDAPCEDAEWTRVSPVLKAVVRKALRRQPDVRFQGVDDMCEALAPLTPPAPPPLSGARLSGAPSSKGPHPLNESLGMSAMALSQRVPLRGRRTRRLALAGTVALGALTLAILRPWQATPASLPATPGMARFAGGEFTMGSSEQEVAAMCATYPRGCPKEVNNEVPPRPVKVAPFELDVHEVTNDDFAGFLRSLSSSVRVVDDDDDHAPRFVHYMPQGAGAESLLVYDLWAGAAGIALSPSKPAVSDFVPRSGMEKMPVALVTLVGARLYCKSRGKRLPLESEWEWAARGSERRLYPWGSEAPRCGGVHIPSQGTLVLVDPERCERDRVAPFDVMSASQDVTPQGVFDLGGNVSEWVEGERSEVSATDPGLVASANDSAVYRGGALDSSFLARATSRNSRLASSVAFSIGFRCAK